MSIEVLPDIQNGLLKALQKKDQAAVNLLFDRYAKVFFAIIIKRCPDAKLAEVILQRCLLTILHTITEFNPNENRLFTWMLRVVRAEISPGHPFNSGFADSGIQNQPGTVTGQEALILMYLHGYSQEDVCRILSIGTGDLKKRLREEIKQLRVLHAE